MTDGAHPVGRLELLLDALGASETDAVTREIIHAFGGDPAVTDRRVGEPGYLSRRLTFASGGEIILHDDAVAAVLLHVVPTATTPRAIDLTTWIPVVGDGSTLDDLAAVFGERPKFAGFGQPYFALDGGFVRAVFRDDRGWKDRGNLLGLSVTDGKPGLVVRPEDDGCPACGDLLVRDASGGVDVEATVASLLAARAAGALTEDAHWVRLADLLPLHASGLMDRAESQTRCTTCRRILCFALRRDAPPTLEYCSLDQAGRHRMDLIPPVAEWGDAARIAQEQEAMQYVDHEPGAWFLVEQQGVLFLQARYSWSALIDDSALIRLDDAEVAAYRTGGHDYLTGLGRGIHDSAPYEEKSVYYARDLYRSPEARAYRDAVQAAIVNHTWIAQQRRP